VRTDGEVAIVATASMDRQSTGTPARSLPATGEVLAGARGGIRHEGRRTRRADDCERCGEYLPAGEGTLEYCVEDSGCMRHHDESGWHVYCADESGCSARREQQRLAQAERAALASEASAARSALIAALPSVTTAPEWLRGDEPVATWARPVMPHTASWPRLHVSAEICWYVPGYFACDMDTPPTIHVGEADESTRALAQRAIDTARAAGLLRVTE